MSQPVNVVVLIHGITPFADPDPRTQYKPMIDGLRERGVDSVPIAVRWGVPDADGSVLRPDQRLAGAERFISERVRFEQVRADHSPQNEVLMHPVERLVERFGIPVLRELLTGVREQFVQYGLADAIYYASADGEHDVRHAVYGRVLGALEEYLQADDVRLHVIGHSLGVTLAHDFLYGLFAPDHDPDFAAKGPSAQGAGARPESEREARSRMLYQAFRERADSGHLHLGTFVSLASQLPLTLLRKRAVVQQLYEQRRLDPIVLGIRPGDVRTRWAIFYDIDDVLGFATRRLYQDHPAIKDVQVHTGLEPLGAHLDYWCDDKVLDEVARLIRVNSR